MTFRKLIFISIAIALCLSCSMLDKQGEVAVESRIPVLLDGSIGGPGTRGENPMVGDGVFSIGVFAGYEADDESFGPESCANDYINNVRYSREATYQPFAGTDVCFWPFSGRLSFFAYTPYLADENLHPSGDYVTGYPKMEYMPTPNVTNQPDFCIANPVLDQHMTKDPIALHFHHSLCQIVFSAGFDDVIPALHYVKIDEIRLCNVIGRKTFQMGNSVTGFAWQSDDTCPAGSRTEYVLTRTRDESTQIADLNIPVLDGDNYLALDTQPGLMYLIPQSLTAGEQYLTITFGTYRTINGQETLMLQARTRVDLPSVEWTEGHRYRFKFSFTGDPSSSVEANVALEDWISSGNSSGEHYIE